MSVLAVDEIIPRHAAFLKISSDAQFTAPLVVVDSSDSTDLATGALKIAGGASIAKKLHMGDDLVLHNVIDPTKVSIIDVNESGNTQIDAAGGSVTVLGTQPATSITDGAFHVLGGASIMQSMHVGTGVVVHNAADAALSATLSVDGNGKFIMVPPMAPHGHVVITTDAVSLDTGAFIIDGGAAIKKHLHVGDAVVVHNITDSTQSASLTVGTDGSFNVSAGGTVINFDATDQVKVLSAAASTTTDTGGLVALGGVGIAGAFNAGAPSSIISSTANQLTLGYDTTVGRKVAWNVSSDGDFSVDCGGNDFNFANTDTVHVLSTTDSTTSATGGFQALGGAGIAKNLHVGGIVNNFSNVVRRDAFANKALGTTAVTTWVSRTTPADAWHDICWSPELGLFCAVGTASNVMTSPDGINWTSRTISSGQWTDVCWSPQLSMFCAVGNLTSGYCIATSYDGISWGTRTCTDIGDVRGVCWSPEKGLFVITAIAGTKRAATSPDGINWTARTSSNDLNSWMDVCWSAELGLFCAVGYAGTGKRVMISSDGVTWTEATGAITASSWFDVCWSPELHLFCAVAIDGTHRVMTSPDGNNWTLVAVPYMDWFDICWSSELGLFCAISKSASGNSQGIMTSPDGVNWTLRTTPDLRWYGICWAPQLGIFCACAANGTTTAVITSTKVFDRQVAVNTPGAFKINGVASVLSTTASTSSSNGALVVSGGLGVAGAINGGGVLTLTTSAEPSSTQLVLLNSGLGGGDGDPDTQNWMCVGRAQSANNSAYFGFSYNTLGSETLNKACVGLYGQAIYSMEWYKSYTKVPLTTASTSASTGALVVYGGAAIGKTLHTGDALTIHNITNATQTATFAVDTGGDVSVDCSGSDFNFANTDVVHVLCTTDSSSSATGGFQALGGAGIAKNLYVGGVLGTSHIAPTVTCAKDTWWRICSVPASAWWGPGHLVINTYGVHDTSPPSTLHHYISRDGNGSMDTTRKLHYLSWENNGGDLLCQGWTTGGALTPYRVYVKSSAQAAHHPNPIYITAYGPSTFLTTPVDCGTGADPVDPEWTAGQTLVLNTATTLSQEVRVGGSLKLNTTTASTSVTTGALVVSGGAAVGKALHTGDALTIHNITNATQTASFSVGTSGALSIDTTGDSINLVAPDRVNVLATTTSNATNTGALVVTGGVGIGANAVIGTGISLLSGETLTPMFRMFALDSRSWIQPGNNGRTAGAWNDIQISPWQDATVYYRFASTGLQILLATASTTTATGALVVTGGVGVGGGMFVGGASAIYNTASIRGLYVYDPTGVGYATFLCNATGALTINASGNLINLDASDQVRVLASTASTSASTGALVVSGGMGVAENINCGGCAQVGSVGTAQVIAGTVFQASYASSINANLSMSGGRVPSQNVGTTSIAGSELNITGAGFLAYLINGAVDGGSQVTLRFLFTPSATMVLNPSVIRLNWGDVANSIKLYMNCDPAGTANPLLVIRNSSGGVIVSGAFMINWLYAIGTQYEMELNCDLISGTHRLFVDGVALPNIVTGTGTRLPASALYVGNNDGTMTCKISKVLVFKTVQHTADYTPTLKATTLSENPTSLVTTGCAGVTGDLSAGGTIYASSASLNQVNVLVNTASTSSSTGALVVRGGAAIGGSLHTGDSVIVGQSLVCYGSVACSSAIVIPSAYLGVCSMYITGYRTVNADYSASSLGTTATIVGDVANVGGKISIPASGSISWPIDNSVDGGQKVAIRVKITPMYSGSPAALTKYAYFSPSNLSRSSIEFYHDTNGLIRFVCVNTGNSAVVNASYSWSPVAGKEYEFEVNIDADAGTAHQSVYIDGNRVMVYAITFVRSSWTPNKIVIGTGSAIKVRDFMVFKSVQHTGTTYTVGYSSTNALSTPLLQCAGNVEIRNSTNWESNAVLAVGTDGDMSVDCSGNDFNFANTDVVHVLATTDSTSVSSGAFVVSGGVAFGRALHIGDALTIHNITNATHTAAFAVDTGGDVSIDCSGSDFNFANTDTVHVLCTTDATSTTSGGFQTLGGAAIGKALHTGDALTIHNITNATHTAAFAVDTGGDLSVDCSGNDFFFANTDTVNIGQRLLYPSLTSTNWWKLNTLGTTDTYSLTVRSKSANEEHLDVVNTTIRGNASCYSATLSPDVLLAYKIGTPTLQIDLYQSHSIVPCGFAAGDYMHQIVTVGGDFYLSDIYFVGTINIPIGTVWRMYYGAGITGPVIGSGVTPAITTTLSFAYPMYLAVGTYTFYMSFSNNAAMNKTTGWFPGIDLYINGVVQTGADLAARIYGTTAISGYDIFIKGAIGTQYLIKYASVANAALVDSGSATYPTNVNLNSIAYNSRTSTSTKSYNDVVVSGTTASTSLSNGALVVIGGAAVGGALHTGDALTIHNASATANTASFTVGTSGALSIDTSGNVINLAATDQVNVLGTTNSTSSTNGALVVQSGGVGISGDLNVSAISTALTYMIDGQVHVNASYSKDATGLSITPEVWGDAVSVISGKISIPVASFLMYPINSAIDVGPSGSIRLYWTPSFAGALPETNIVSLGVANAAGSVTLTGNWGSANNASVVVNESGNTSDYTFVTNTEYQLELNWSFNAGNLYVTLFINGQKITDAAGGWPTRTESAAMLYVGGAAACAVREIMIFNTPQHTVNFTPVYYTLPLSSFGGDLTVRGNLNVRNAMYLPSLGGTASPLNYYEEINMVSSVTGAFDATDAFVARLTRIGRVVTMTVQPYTAASTVYLPLTASTAIVARMRPYIDLHIPCRVADNDITVPGTMVVLTNGIISFYVDFATNFTASGNACWWDVTTSWNV